MAGWSHEKRTRVETAFYQYLDRCYVNSRDGGRICLGEAIYEGQRRVITEIFDGLEDDIHTFVILKSRQLGISTIIRALTIFLLGIFPGLKGAIVFDTDNNKVESRSELEVMIEELPKSLKFPPIKTSNRSGLMLGNNSKVLFMSAGVKKSKSSGTLGRSVGLSVAHGSELCSWDNEEGWEAFKASLSDSNPDRIYIWESTARGYNFWHEVCKEAKNDPNHQRFIFIGWWSKDSQRIEREHPDFELYGTTPPSEKEQYKIELVRKLYNVEITPEQLAWVRRNADPTAQGEGDADPDFEPSALRLQEQPWTEEDAWQQTGSIFFPQQTLTEITGKDVSRKFSGWMFLPGAEFVDMKVIKAPNARNIDLKVWEEPDPDGVYAMGVDPAFGENPDNDRSSIEIYRCYADGLDQVAEYASPLINTRQLGWVIAALLGWYGGGANAIIKYGLELNGPGGAVFTALRDLKAVIDSGIQRADFEERGLQNIFRNVRTYLYQRVDGMGAGYNYHFKCLAVDTLLPTPAGWKLLADVVTGDKLFDEKGNPCTVLAVSDVKYNNECFRVTFDDGSSLIADAEHLWKVSSKRRRGATYSLVTTKALDTSKHSIRMVEPLNLPAADLPIDPYVLGLWLGDGYSANGRFCAHADDIEELSSHIKNAGFSLGEVGRARTMDYRNIVGLIALLRSSNLWNNKHIPRQYLRASKEQRLALLQGLMDTDGTINPNNGRQCNFATTNMALAVGFAELVRSLGIKAKWIDVDPVLKYKGTNVKCARARYFRFTYRNDLPVFRLARKLKKARCFRKQKERTVVTRHHRIVSVEPVPSVPVKCIQVDSPSHLFLAGASMIPTHNTTGPLKITYLERFRDFVTNGTCRLRSLDLVDEMKTVAREGDSIKAPGTMKDDRVLSSAFAIHVWETGLRRMLMTARRTRDAEAARKRLSIVDQVQLYNTNQLGAFFDQKRRIRVAAQRAAIRQAWRYR